MCKNACFIKTVKQSKKKKNTFSRKQPFCNTGACRSCKGLWNQTMFITSHSLHAHTTSMKDIKTHWQNLTLTACKEHAHSLFLLVRG